MARFHGKVGYLITEDVGHGIHKERIIERPYFGDVNRQAYNWSAGSSLNDNITISNEFSIVADAFAYENLYTMKYITYLGTKWKITNANIARPRIILSIGGIYNAPHTSGTGC